MIARYRILASRLRDEIATLDSTAEAIGRHWRGFKTVQSDQDAYLNSVAFGLQSLYSGIERILELVAEQIDGGVVGGESWHAELLRQMATDCPACALRSCSEPAQIGWTNTASSATSCGTTTPPIWSRIAWSHWLQVSPKDGRWSGAIFLPSRSS